VKHQESDFGANFDYDVTMVAISTNFLGCTNSGSNQNSEYAIKFKSTESDENIDDISPLMPPKRA
jgi:hypothetical protein